MFLRSIPIIASLAFCGTIYAGEKFEYDKCSDIFREGVRDELTSSSSKKHTLVKHNQFCSIAKKHTLNEDNFHQFSKDYAKQVNASRSTAGGDASVGYGIFSFDASYDQSHESSSLSEKDRENLLISNKKEVLDYFESNCGNSSYQEQLETEAQSMSRIANPHLIAAWTQCMAKKHGVFAYIEGDTDAENFGVRVEWFSNGNNYVKELYMKWYGDNIQTGLPLQVHEGSGNFKLTTNICSEKPIYHGGNTVIPIRRASNSISEIVYVTSVADNGHQQAFSISLPKLLSVPKYTKPAKILQRHVLDDGGVLSAYSIHIEGGHGATLQGGFSCNSIHILGSSRKEEDPVIVTDGVIMADSIHFSSDGVCTLRGRSCDIKTAMEADTIIIDAK